MRGFGLFFFFARLIFNTDIWVKLNAWRMIRIYLKNDGFLRRLKSEIRAYNENTSVRPRPQGLYRYMAREKVKAVLYLHIYIRSAGSKDCSRGEGNRFYFLLRIQPDVAWRLSFFHRRRLVCSSTSELYTSMDHFQP